MVASNRIKASEVKEAQRVALAEQLYRQKLEEAEKRHSEYIKSIRGRAGNENTKVLPLTLKTIDIPCGTGTGL
jgi:hypothetical protein